MMAFRKKTWGSHFAPWIVVLLIWIVSRIACAVYVERDTDQPPPEEARVFVSDLSETVMQPLDVLPPQQERWRDIAGAAYARGFRDDFDYSDTHTHQAEVQYEDDARTLRGTVNAEALKPSFAYQLKLVGLTPVLGADEVENVADTRAWSSWQLGRLGRWWCADCTWNLRDDELAAHLDDGHRVTGYLLFDWLVTDEHGNARHEFALDSSLHVLWRVGQRERGRHDTPPRWYTVTRPPDIYQPAIASTDERVGLFGEWEPDRPLIGEARLAPGTWEVGFNLTEESFHDNMDEERMLPGGGFWAWVMQSELQFEVRSGDPSVAHK
ncbi:MAG: hypothetical protein R6V07_16040 [Armatimonadota bacterium]